MIIAVEGSISSGKTTLLDLIQDNCNNIHVMKEPWDLGKNLLKKFYEDPFKHAYEFQLRMLARRAHTHCIAQRDYGDKVVVLERTIGADANIFSQITRHYGYLNDDQYQDYCETYDDLSFFVKEPDLYIYLKAPIPLLLERIARRDRDGEEKIDIGYLYKLEEYHEKWLCNGHGNNVEVFNIDKETTLDDMINKFISCLKKYQ